MKAIQISGVGRSGKSTVATMIAAIAIDQGYIPVMVPFAKALKDEADDLGFSKEESPDEYRAFCQKLGADRREVDPDYWVKKAQEDIEEVKKQEAERKKHANGHAWEYLIIQDDVRYMNELIYGREIGAYQLFVTPYERKIAEEDSSWRSHESERIANLVEAGDRNFSDVYHEYVVNDKDIDSLAKKVKSRFYAWISDPDPCGCSLCEMYRSGLVPTVRFLNDELYDELLGDLDDFETD